MSKFLSLHMHVGVFFVVQGSNPEPCIYYALFLSTDLSSQRHMHVGLMQLLGHLLFAPNETWWMFLALLLFSTYVPSECWDAWIWDDWIVHLFLIIRHLPYSLCRHSCHLSLFLTTFTLLPLSNFCHVYVVIESRSKDIYFKLDRFFYFEDIKNYIKIWTVRSWSNGYGCMKCASLLKFDCKEFDFVCALVSTFWYIFECAFVECWSLQVH